MKKYKVWVVVEEQNNLTDEYKDLYDIGIKTFDTEAEALELANAIADDEENKL